jgi:hypothetical protein
MAYMRGEDINVGFAVETTRLTAVSPQIWIPARTPSGINVEVIKTMMKETKGKGIVSQGSEIVGRKAVGDLEFNLRAKSIGYILKSLLGKCTTTTQYGTAKKHLFEVLTGNPEFPTLTVGLAQEGGQHYAYNGNLINSLEIRTPVDDLVNATINFEGADEAEHTNYTVSFNAADYLFRPQDVSIKIANNVAGLATASALKPTEFAISIKNNGKIRQTIGSATPTNNLAGLMEISGTIKLDYEGKTYHDLYKTGAYKAMSISIVRGDIDYGGSTNPSITITLPKISIEKLGADRPLDDVVTESLEFNAHYDDTEAKAIKIEVINDQASYAA